MDGKRIREFRRMIFIWWKTHRRDLPWRRTHDPYRILVSEVMLQQTQVPRVLPKYREFIKRFPTITDLAKASTADVLRMWKGMGYNRRAIYLKKITYIPSTEQELIKLPGIGKYTARAILVFAFKKDIAAVDTNIRQIITHFFFKDRPQKENKIQEVADKLVPAGKSWEWHQALMDYGALEMTKLKIKKKKKKLGIPFIQSNRYIRGKIMNIVREGAVVEPPRLTRVIDGLVKDGLVERKNGKIQLPDGY